ncbi:exonuclease domain-containing protein [Telmatospirillum sp. J64-1]|uniref:exonuclease domain-containing protein n=1 Tax=Telmatospirillum sp. J64-1 TaxID=2502183 RepID=UPI00115D0DC4|nr:exonuclease domain-containing protein [Telmatospirillum sp. J64-1]
MHLRSELATDMLSVEDAPASAGQRTLLPQAKPRARRLFQSLLLIQAFSLVALAGIGFMPRVVPDLVPPVWLVGLAAGLGGLVLWILWDLLRDHFEDLKLVGVALNQTLRGEVPPERLVTRWQGPQVDEVGHLARLIVEIASGRALEKARPDQRLASVIGALGDAVVVITESGQVSLINSAGKSLLGEQRAAVGTSIYAALDYDSLSEAMERARNANRRAIEAVLLTVDGEEIHARITDFGEHRGAVLTFSAEEVEHFHEVEHALDMHDRPPEPLPPLDDTLLSELPGLVLDTETTGLDVTYDSVISIGAVRTHGTRIYRGVVMDCLVNPGRSIPARSTAIHGITNAMVADAPPFGHVVPQLNALMTNTVFIGHNAGYDIAMLRRAYKAAGQPWRDPPWLDVLLLSAALDPKETDLNLESIALRLGVNVTARHTALGDALVTAEVFTRLLPRLEERGIRTLGDAVEFSQTARQMIAAQRSAGW